MDASVLYGFPAAVLIVGVVTVAKWTGLPSQYAPALSLVLGLLAGVGIGVEQGTSLLQGIVTGLGAGLMACGAYDQGKKIVSIVSKESPTETGE